MRNTHQVAVGGCPFADAFEHSFNITDDFTMYYNVGLLNTNVDSYEFKTNDTTTVTLGNREQAQAPKYTYNYGLKYKYPFGITFSCEVSGKYEFYFSDSHDQTSESYTLMNLTVGKIFQNATIKFWARNMLDVRYTVRGFYFGLIPPDYPDQLWKSYGDPRQIGITLDYNY